MQIKQVIVWLGPGFFLFFLGMFNLVQTFVSRSGQETAAKLIVNCLGFLTVFWLWNTYRIDHLRHIKSFLTAPAPVSASTQFWYAALAAVGMFGFSFVLESLGDLTKEHSVTQAITVFFSCVAIYLLAPLALLLADPVPLIEANFFHIATGLAIGGMVYLIFLLFGLAKLKARLGK